MPDLTPPVARTHLLIRRPVAEVFAAFVDPAVTSRFWFSRGSGPLVQGTRVVWSWDMYGFSANVDVVTLDEGTRIVVNWPAPVEWTFAPRGDAATFVTITASGFTGTPDEQVSGAIDSMGGFSFVLAAAKAWLEHGVALNIVADHNPDHHVAPR